MQSSWLIYTLTLWTSIKMIRYLPVCISTHTANRIFPEITFYIFVDWPSVDLTNFSGKNVVMILKEDNKFQKLILKWLFWKNSASMFARRNKTHETWVPRRPKTHSAINVCVSDLSFGIKPKLYTYILLSFLRFLKIVYNLHFHGNNSK